MQEVFGSLWEVEANLRCITTNGAIRRDGACVMGRGCAYEAKTKFPGIDVRLGELLREYGNRVMRLHILSDGSHLASFPVNHHWKEEADPILIRRSAEQFVALADKFGYERIVIPRPGCGNGRLSWADVRPILAEVLDDRFAIITLPPRNATRRTEDCSSRPHRLELRTYDSADDLGRGRSNSVVLPEEHPTKEAAGPHLQGSRHRDHRTAPGLTHRASYPLDNH